MGRLSGSRSLSVWMWTVGAIAAGAACGFLTVRGISLIAALCLGAAAIALVMATFWRIEIGLIALLFTLPLDTFGRLIEKPVTVTVYHVVLLICMGAWARSIVTKRGGLHLGWMDVAIAAFVGAGLWSLPASLAPSTTAVSTLRLVFLWAFAALYANNITDERGLRRVIVWFVGIGVGLSAVGIAQYFVPNLGVGWIRDVLRAGGAISFSRVGAFFYDPNYFAGLLSAVTTVSLAMLAHAHVRREALLWGGAAAVSGFTLVLTFSRGGWVAAAAGIVVVVLTAPRRRRAWLLGGLVTIAVVLSLASPGLVTSRVQSITNVETDVSVATRYYMAISMGQMIAARPVSGTGLGAFDHLYPYYRHPGTSLAIVKPHQVPLGFIAETGIAGALAELTLVVALAMLYVRRRPNGFGALEAAALVGTVAMLVGTLFEYYLYFEYVWLFIGLSAAATRLGRSDKEAA